VSSPLAQATDDGWVDQQPEIRMREVYAGRAAISGCSSSQSDSEPALRFSL
jgi:hypothetical protein